MALGAFCGIFSLILVEYSLEPGVVDSYGRISYRSEVGMLVFLNMVVVVNWKVGLMSHGWSVGVVVREYVICRWPWRCRLLRTLLSMGSI